MIKFIMKTNIYLFLVLSVFKCSIASEKEISDAILIVYADSLGINLEKANACLSATDDEIIEGNVVLEAQLKAYKEMAHRNRWDYDREEAIETLIDEIEPKIRELKSVVSGCCLDKVGIDSKRIEDLFEKVKGIKTKYGIDLT